MRQALAPTRATCADTDSTTIGGQRSGSVRASIGKCRKGIRDSHTRAPHIVHPIGCGTGTRHGRNRTDTETSQHSPEQNEERQRPHTCAAAAVDRYTR